MFNSLVTLHGKVPTPGSFPSPSTFSNSSNIANSALSSPSSISYSLYPIPYSPLSPNPSPYLFPTSSSSSSSCKPSSHKEQGFHQYFQDLLYFIFYFLCYRYRDVFTSINPFSYNYILFTLCVYLISNTNKRFFIIFSFLKLVCFYINNNNVYN